jgi:hypothetical protein
MGGTGPDLQDVYRRTVDVLERLGVQWTLIGAHAVNVYTRPRATATWTSLSRGVRSSGSSAPSQRNSVDRMLASDTFAGAERSRVLLTFLVKHAVEDQTDRLKEYTIGSEALGRGDSFDPRTDPIVRAEASRLRSRIERSYATNTVLITLPKGSYIPQFQRRAIPEAAPVAASPGPPSRRRAGFRGSSGSSWAASPSELR